MPSYEVTYAEVKKITIWVPAGAGEDQRKLLAMDHMALAMYAGVEGKLLSILPTATFENITEPNVAPIK